MKGGDYVNKKKKKKKGTSSSKDLIQLITVLANLLIAIINLITKLLK
ncbi:hypothetical protein [Clostridium paraputrificum]